MKTLLEKLALAFALLCTTHPLQAEPGMVMVQAQVASGKDWTNYPTRTLAVLPTAVTSRVDSELDQYGGLLARKVKATGYFYPTKIGERWWLVDPEGCLLDRKSTRLNSSHLGIS